MKRIITLCVLLWGLNAFANQTVAPNAKNNAETIDFLKKLELAELLEIEVALDDAFDVFDGLVHRRRVTVASGLEQSMARAPAVTTVITAQDIEASGANELDEVLESVPGLHVSWDNFYNPIYTLRGIYSLTNPEVLMMVNSIPLRDLTAGNRGVAWGGWPVNNIARIEIIRGPGSAVYGADAFAGVINIITKQAEDISGTETGLRVGSDDNYNAWLLRGGKWNGIEIAAALEVQDTNGSNEIITVDRQTLLDRQSGTNASHAPSAIQRGRQRLDANLDLRRNHWRLRAAFQVRDKLGVGAGTSSALDPEGYLSEERYQLDLTYHNPLFTKYWDVQVQASVLDRQFESHHINLFPAGVRLPFPERSQGVVYANGVWQSHSLDQRYSRLNIQTLFSGWKNHVWRLGVGYAYEDLYHTTYLTNRVVTPGVLVLPPEAEPTVLDDTLAVIVPEKARQNSYAFIQDTWVAADRLELTLGMRYDNYSDFGNTVNPRAALVWQTTPKFTSKLLYGQAFRAPAFRELYVRNNLFLGSSDLKAETIEMWELALDWNVNDYLNFTANSFYFEIEDKILFVPREGSNLLYAENKGSQDGYGVELEARWKLSARASLLFNYAYTHSQTQEDDGNQDIGHYPRHKAYLRSDWLVHNHWYLDVQAHWVASRQRPPGDTRPLLTDYSNVNLTLRYKDIQEKRWNFAVGIRNVFDTDQRESVNTDILNDLPLPARHFFVELRYRF